jgi:hypothetical protein
MILFVAVSAPVVWRGAPLADDFNNCVAPIELGLLGFLKASWLQLGGIRPARFLEILLGAAVCNSVPFGVSILVSVCLTLLVGWQARGLLHDLGTPAPWADIGGALWLLQPLGTEAGLWPAALHVPLGLLLALIAIRLYRRAERLAWAAMATVGAVLSVEQVIFPLPLVVWLVTPRSRRRRAALVCAAVGACTIGGFLLWPGANPRLRAGLVDRIVGLWANPQFYVGYPAVGLGMHSIPLAIWWAWPWSVGALALGAAAGAAVGRSLVVTQTGGPVRRPWQLMYAVLAIVALTNLVVFLAVPQQGSPRVFAPTWLVVAMAVPLAASAVSWHRPRLLGALGGVFLAGAALSLAFSVSVRMRNADFTERATAIVASRVSEGGRVAVCGVTRTVVQLAPRGAFAVHDFIYEWAAERALTFYTGRRATIVLAGELWDRPCPDPGDVEAVIHFDELLAGARP